ncbi:hypothetical protein KIL84_021243 [Mauremys mutica]|uniref:Uncharacterized protein n=1 Tax=Mauremys mutica TaxID=74926 RepID=A0A9D3X9Q5_9SAUR|nr:hypothetical protein KIL84_021243 [Mauremys mutica]
MNNPLLRAPQMDLPAGPAQPSGLCAAGNGNHRNTSVKEARKTPQSLKSQSAEPRKPHGSQQATTLDWNTHGARNQSIANRSRGCWLPRPPPDGRGEPGV